MRRDANGRRSAMALPALTRLLFTALVAAISQPALAADPPPNMDDEIGRVVSALNRKKLLANTVIVFQSDNGPHPERANELAGQMAKSPLLQAEFQTMMKRLAMPPALPGEEFEFNVEPQATPSSAKPGGPGRGGTAPRR